MACGAAACDTNEPSTTGSPDAAAETTTAPDTVTEPPDAANDALPEAGPSNPPADVTTEHSVLDVTRDVKPETAGDGDPPASCVGSGVGSVWKPTSSAIEIRAFHLFKGQSGYLQQRTQLTAAQMTALDGLCLIPTPTTRLTDSMTYRIVVADQDGTQTSYRASAFNYLDGNVGLPTVDVHSLEPFLATFSCTFSGEPRFPPTGADAGSWDWAATMGTDPGCINGVYARSHCTPNWVKLRVDAPLTASIEVFECSGPQGGLRLFTPDGATVLAASSPGDASPCPYVSHAFAQAGTYLLSIDGHAGDCDAGLGLVGDVSLRVRP
jgi:hypothetical protein